MKQFVIILGMVAVILLLANIAVLVSYKQYLQTHDPNGKHRLSLLGSALAIWLSVLAYYQFRTHPEITLSFVIIILLANIQHTYRLRQIDTRFGPHTGANRRKPNYRPQTERTDKDYSVGDIPWLYIHRYPPPRGQKIHILQAGGISIQGQWRDDSGFLAWQHLHCRDRVQEAELAVWLKEQQAKKELENEKQERLAIASETNSTASTEADRAAA